MEVKQKCSSAGRRWLAKKAIKRASYVVSVDYLSYLVNISISADEPNFYLIGFVSLNLLIQQKVNDAVRGILWHFFPVQ